MSCYEWLWKRVGGRPWSYIIRDNARGNLVWWLLGFLVAGVVLGHLFW